MGKQKNDYSVVVFLSTGEVKKWSYVGKLDGFTKFLNEKHSAWMYMNVYNRRTREFLKRFYSGNKVPTYL